MICAGHGERDQGLSSLVRAKERAEYLSVLRKNKKALPPKLTQAKIEMFLAVVEFSAWIAQQRNFRVSPIHYPISWLSIQLVI